MFVIVDSVHGEPGGRYETEGEAVAVVEGMVADGLAEPGQFSVLERDGAGRVVRWVLTPEDRPQPASR